MIFRAFLANFLIPAVLAGSMAAAHAAPKIHARPAAVPVDETFLKAYEAFRAGNPLNLQKYSSLPAGHVLTPYLEYWRLKLRIDDAGDDEVRAFLDKQTGTYLADRLRADWLKVLGKRADWPGFDRELSPLVQDDLDIRCYAWLSRLARGDESAHDEARAIWLEPRELPDGCHTLADRMSEAGRFSVDDVWRRVRMLLENGQLNAA